jgi:hypothetical protein
LEYLLRWLHQKSKKVQRQLRQPSDLYGEETWGKDSFPAR